MLRGDPAVGRSPSPKVSLSYVTVYRRFTLTDWDRTNTRTDIYGGIDTLENRLKSVMLVGADVPKCNMRPRILRFYVLLGLYIRIHMHIWCMLHLISITTMHLIICPS